MNAKTVSVELLYKVTVLVGTVCALALAMPARRTADMRNALMRIILASLSQLQAAAARVRMSRFENPTLINRRFLTLRRHSLDKTLLSSLSKRNLRT